jgi:hypothetical protein
MFETIYNDWVTYAQSLDPSKLYGGAALAIALLFLILRLCYGCRAKKVIAYSTEGGRVIVNRSAIVELVQSACAQIQDVSKPRVRICIRGGIPHFQVRLKLASDGHLREVEASLQKHLRDALTLNLGIEKLGKIDVIATGFRGSRLKKSTPELPEEPAD